jgi:hypothetical protein
VTAEELIRELQTMPGNTVLIVWDPKEDCPAHIKGFERWESLDECVDGQPVVQLEPGELL